MGKLPFPVGSYRILHLLVTILYIIWDHRAQSHGRLIEPPSRSSAWRYGFNTTANYNDHELYCGGFSRQYKTNKGNCGICGDPYDLPQPRPNEAGGVYGQGVIVRQYRVDSIIRIKVELTANHRGYFEFRLCPNNNPKKIATQKCLDKNILHQSNGEGERYIPSEGTKVFESRYLLPRGLTCSQCILQWRYVAGNNWGRCENGTQAVGCGPQEEFRACADVAITDSAGRTPSPSEADEEVTTVPSPPPSTKSEEDEPSALPFIMAIIGFILAATGVGILFGWFYRKEILQFIRKRMNKSNWKMGENGTHFVAGPTPNSVPILNGPENHGFYGRPTVPPPPIPPPRNKKNSSSDLKLNDEAYENQKNMAGWRGATPDIISEPLSLTINGLAI